MNLIGTRWRHSAGYNMIAALHRERRRVARVKVDLSAQFCIYLPSCPDVASPSIAATAYDLSEDGIGLLTNTIDSDGLHILHPTVSTLEQCFLVIEIPYGNELLTLKGKAVWYDRNLDKQASIYRVGVRLLDVDQNLRGKIRTLAREESCGATNLPA